jgi:hypothetical protein
VLRLTVFPLLAYFDSQLHDDLLGSCSLLSPITPLFCLSWILTCFSHDLAYDPEIAKRLFDCFLASHPLMPVYLTVSMMVHPVNRTLLTEQISMGDDALVYQTLQSLPRNCVDRQREPTLSFLSASTLEGKEESDDDYCSVVSPLDSPARSSGSAETATTIDTSAESSVDTVTAVPVQEVIDAAVTYMRRVPPSDVVDLAARYHGAEQVEEWLDQCQDPIIMLQHFSLDSPPAVAARTAKDEFLEMEQEQDGSGEEQIWQFLRENSSSPAVIAAGFGVGDRTLLNRRRRCKKQRRRILLLAAVTTVTAGSILYKLLNGRRRQSNPPPMNASGLSSDTCSPSMPLCQEKKAAIIAFDAVPKPTANTSLLDAVWEEKCGDPENAANEYLVLPMSLASYLEH